MFSSYNIYIYIYIYIVDIIMAPLRNEFLLNLVLHDNLRMDCFCTNCKHLRVVNYSALSTQELHKLFHVTLVEKEDVQLHQYHKTVLQMIAAGKTLKDVALLNTGYKYFGSWARRALPYCEWDGTRRKSFCDSVNQAVRVFEGWDKIVENLTHYKIDQIDARRFSINYFDLARSDVWCIEYNEQLRHTKGKSDVQLYPEAIYQDIRAYVLNSGALEGMETPNDPKIAAKMMKRLSTEIVTTCSKRPRPPPPSPPQSP